MATSPVLRRAALAAAPLLVWVLAAGLACRGSPSEPVRIQIDAGRRGQVMSGWEAVAQAGQELPGFPAYERQLFDLAVNDLGINRVRLEVRSGIEHPRDTWREQLSGALDPKAWRAIRYATVNDNDDPFTIDWSGFQFAGVDDKVRRVVLPMKKRLAARGETLFVNATYVAFTRQIGSGFGYAHENPEEYAEFVLATYLHMQQTFGWVPDAWNVILEPDNTEYWRGESIGRAIVAAGRRLARHGFTPRFIAPSTTNMANAPRYFDRMIEVPHARDYLAELSYHRYHGVSDATLDQIADRAERFAVPTAMLEHMESGYQDLHADLIRGRVSAWEQYALAYPGGEDSGKYYTIDAGSQRQPRVTMTDNARYLRQYFRHVRRGAIRIHATSADDRLSPVAFVNTDGRTVVVIKASTSGAAAIVGLRPGWYGISYAIAARSADAPDADVSADRELRASIPAAGVLTIHAR